MKETYQPSDKLGEKFNKVPIVDFGPALRQLNEPERNMIAMLDPYFYIRSQVTRPRVLDRLSDSGNTVWSPLFQRKDRADLYHAIKATKNRTERKRLLSQAKQENEIIKSYLTNQHNVKVDLPELGQQMTRMDKFIPPESIARPEKGIELFIARFASDPASIASICAQKALRGEEVWAIGHPEATMGKPTPEFIKSMALNLNETGEVSFEPHVSFYKAIIEKIYQEQRKPLRFAGYSTGASIIAQILSDPKYSQMVSEAELFAPAGGVEQSVNRLNFDLFTKELPHVVSNPNLASYEFIRGNKTPDSLKHLKSEAQKIQFKKIVCLCPHFLTARVMKGGKITVVSMEGDMLSKSSKAKNFFLINPQVEFISIPNATHATLVLEPNRVLNTIEHYQKLNRSNSTSI